MTKKKNKNIIVMAVLVVVLLIAVICAKVFNRDEETAAENYTYALSTLKSDQIRGVEYEYADGVRASYKYADGKWYNADDLNFPMSTTAFSNQFVDVFLGLTSSKRIADFEGDLSEFGLDAPDLTLSVTGSGSTTTYKVGKYNGTLKLYYMMVNDDRNNIYMIDDELIHICREDIYDYASIDDFPAYSLSNLNYIEFQSGEIVSHLVYSEDGFEEDVSGYKWKWAFDYPFGKRMTCENSLMDTLQEDVLDVLAYSKTVNYKATEEELASYGLDKPRGSYTINETMEDDSGNKITASITVYIGNRSEEEGGYYTRQVITEGLNQEKSNVVRILSSSMADSLLGINPLEYITSNIMFLTIEDINNSYITFNNGKNEYTFSFIDGDSDSTSDDVYKMGDKEVDSKEFRDLWYQMVSVKPERIVYDKTTLKTGEPVYTIFSKRSKDDYYGDITVEFVKYDATYYQVDVNGITDMLMRRTDIDSFFANITEFGEANK